MKRDTRPRAGDSKSNAFAQATAKRGKPQASSAASSAVSSTVQRLDAPASGGNNGTASVSVTVSARYIDSRLKQFCLR